MSGFKDFSDHKLLRHLLRSEIPAFDEIYRRYSLVIYKTAIRFLQDDLRAADLVQEIFTRVWVDRRKFSDVKNLEAYLVTMSRNLALKYLREMARENVARQEWADRMTGRLENNIESHIHKKELEMLLKETIVLLPPQQQKVYYLARMKGLTYQAISDQLNISTVTVKKQMIAANRFVRNRIPPTSE